MVSRREFGRYAAAALPLLAAPARLFAQDAKNDTIHGVAMGMESYSLATLPHAGVLDALIELMQELGLREVSLFEPVIQPDGLVAVLKRAREGLVVGAPETPAVKSANEAIRDWRASVSLGYFVGIRKKFERAGLRVYRYQPTGLTARSGDEELVRVCEINRALGGAIVTTSMPHSVARRFVPLTDRYGIKVGIQGRPDEHATDPDQIARPEDYEKAVTYSPNYGIELDIGDATGAGFDVLRFVAKNHARMYGINLKDRKRDRTSMPWGQGDTPVAGILRMVRDGRYPIRCYIDCDYATAPGGDRVEDVRRCMQYAETALA